MAKKKQLRIMVIGAHPDDCEIQCGGTAALWAKKGHRVLFVSATNGVSGHHALPAHEVAQRRIAEARAAADVIGIDSLVLPISSGQLEPTLVYRAMFLRAIRTFSPDLVLTHRPNDYHPDHRYTAQIVQDCSYLLRVPYNAPETPAMRYSPAIMYLCDEFQKPIAFQADVVVGIDSVIEKKIDMLDCHASQVYEWLPWANDPGAKVPTGQAARRKWMAAQQQKRYAGVADRFRGQLIVRYGQQAGQAVRYAEAFEACEYGAKLTPEKLQEFFGGM